MGWLIVPVIVLLLAVMPVGFRLIYSVQGPMAWMLLGPIRFRLMKGGKKQKDAAENKTAAVGNQNTGRGKAGGSLRDFLPIAERVLKLLNHLRRKLRVNMLELKLLLAGDDPSDLAVNYGRTWAGIGTLVPFLEHYFIIKKREIDVSCDFSSDKTMLYFRMDISITIGRFICLAATHGIGLLRDFFKVINKRKGGAKA